MTWKRNIEGMKSHAQRRAQEARERVDQAITMLVRECKTINFNTVAHAAGVTKSYLYTQTDLRERIEVLRQQHIIKMHQQPSRERSDASKEMLLVAKDRRIKALEAENRRLKEDLKKAIGRVYDQI